MPLIGRNIRFFLPDCENLVPKSKNRSQQECSLSERPNRPREKLHNTMEPSLIGLCNDRVISVILMFFGPLILQIYRKMEEIFLNFLHSCSGKKMIKSDKVAATSKL